MREFNLQGKVIRSTDLAGRVTTTAWDCCHKISETQPDGSTTTWDYDDEGRMIAASRLIPIDMTNVTWLTACYSYDDLGRQTVTWQTNSTAKVGTPSTRTAYDALGRVVARSDPGRGTLLRLYSVEGLVVTNTAPNGATTITHRNGDGDMLFVTGTAVTPEFHAYGILPDGTRWHKTVQGETASSPRFTQRYENMLGQAIREERSGFRGAVLAAVSAYDGYGRLVSTTSDGEPTAEYSYDSFGARIATTRTVGSRVPRDRDGEWRKSESSSAYALADGKVWLVQTNVTSCSDASIAPLVTSQSVQLTGLTAANPSRTRTTDIRGNVTESWTEFTDGFSIAKRRVPEATNISIAKTRYGVSLETVSISEITNRIEYDALGRTIAEIDGRGNAIQTRYNAAGLRSASFDGAGNPTHYAYDNFGQLVAVTNALGHVTVYEYDLRGRKTYEGGATYPVRYTYDVFGSKTTMMTYRNESLGPDSGDVTTWLYDEASGMLTNKVYADGLGPSYSYDANGHLIRRIWARGVVTDYAYDGWGICVTTEYSDGTASVTNAYDALGRKTFVADAVGAIEYAYDAYGSITSETWNDLGRHVLARHYDDYGRNVGYSIDNMRTTSIGYDVASGALNGMHTLEGDFSWQYLFGSHLKSRVIYPNGVNVDYTYEANRDLLTSVTNHLETTVYSSYAYCNDVLGRSISKNDAHYDYNSRNELTSATGTESCRYQYDDIGNRVSSLEFGTNATYIANVLNQYASVSNAIAGTFAPTYDADGNQTLVKASTGMWHVMYSGENRPVCWSNGTMVVTMDFDSMGRRTFYREATNGVERTLSRFFYDGYVMIRQHLTNSIYNVYNEFIWDPTEPIATKPFCFRQNGQVSTFLAHDCNKNVTDLISAAPHNDSVGHYGYAPFGTVRSMTGTRAVDNTFRFSSEYSDDTLGLAYYNYRHYEPMTGRWMTRDPIGENVSGALYLFVRNNNSNHDLLGELELPGGSMVAIWLLLDAYMKMRDANTIGADKWFHCMGMCRAGVFSTSTATFIAYAREMGDLIKRYLKENYRATEDLANALYEQFIDSLSDMEANTTGLRCPHWVKCECCCKKYHDQAPTINPGDWF